MSTHLSKGNKIELKSTIEQQGIQKNSIMNEKYSDLTFT